MSSGLKLGLGREEEDEDGESCRLGLGLCFVSCPRVLVGPDQLRGRLNYLSIKTSFFKPFDGFFFLRHKLELVSSLIE